MNKKILLEDMEEVFKSNLAWERFSGKTILITGANGFLPAYMTDFLMFLNEQNKIARKCKIIALVRNLNHANERFSDYENDENFTLWHQDVSDKIEITDKIDFIIHAASPASPKYYKVDPVGVSLPNVIGTHNVLDLAAKNSISSMLFFSSGEVYGDVQKNKISEGDYGPLNPLELRSCYAESKRMGESLCFSYCHQHKVPVKIVRPFHTYGPGMKLDDGRVFSDFVSNIIKNENIVLKSDGLSERVFCYLADAVGGFFTILLNGENGEAYNLANPRELVDMKSLAELLTGFFPEKKLQVITKIELNNNYVRSKSESLVADISKINKLGWIPKTSLEDGFKKTIKSYGIIK